MSKYTQWPCLCYLQQKEPWVINFAQTDLTWRKGTYYLGSRGSGLTNNNDNEKY